MRRNGRSLARGYPLLQTSRARPLGKKGLNYLGIFGFSASFFATGIGFIIIFQKTNLLRNYVRLLAFQRVCLEEELAFQNTFHLTQKSRTISRFNIIITNIFPNLFCYLLERAFCTDP